MDVEPKRLGKVPRRRLSGGGAPSSTARQVLPPMWVKLLEHATCSLISYGPNGTLPCLAASPEFDGQWALSEQVRPLPCKQ